MLWAGLCSSSPDYPAYAKIKLMNISTGIRAVIFDYGSVLVRMRDETPRVELAETYGISLDDLYHSVFDSPTAFPACVGDLAVDEHWDAVMKSLNIPFAEKNNFLHKFWSADALNTELIDFIRQVLRPHYKLGLLSNAWDDLRHVLDQRWGIIADFDELIISAEVRDAKPNTSIYQLTLERLGVLPEDTVFVDDVLQNVEGAQAVGIHAIQYIDNSQLFAALERLGI